MSDATTRTGRRADVAASDVSAIVNEAYFEVWYASQPEESEKIAVSSTTSGENKIELPTDFWEPISATLIWSTSTASSAISSYQTFRLVSALEMDARNPVPGGVPRDIAFYNSWLELWPSPNSAYSFQLRYRAHPEDMTSTASVPSVSTPWRRAIALKARELVAAHVGDWDREQKASVDYLRYVSTLKTAQAVRQSSEMPSRFVPTQDPSRGRRRAR